MFTTKTRYKNSPSQIHTVVMMPLAGIAPQCAGTNVNVPFIEPSQQTGFEIIRSDDDARQRHTWKAVDHYKVEYTPSDCSPSYHTAVQYTPSAIGARQGAVPTRVIAGHVNGFCVPNMGDVDLFTNDGNGFSVNSPPSLDVLVDASLTHMLPKLDSELNLPNTLIELRDFRSLPRTFRRVVDLSSSIGRAVRHTIGPQFIRRIRRTFSSSYGPTLAETARTSADVYLQSQFNVLPLLQEVTGIYTTLVKAYSTINLLLQNEQKVITRRYRRILDSSFLWSNWPETTFHITDDNWYYNQSCGQVGGNSLGYKISRKTLKGSCVFRAAIEYQYFFSDFQREYAHILGLLDMVGVNLNPAIIWNAIPWSFVVDWVAGVGQWLDKRKVLNMQPYVNVRRYMWSIKYTRTVRSFHNGYQQIPYSGGMIDPTQCRLPDVHETAYKRSVNFPTSSPVILNALTLKKLSLGLALAITRRKPRNRLHQPRS